MRGKLIGQIVDEQVAAAAAMQADVVTLVGGLNDTLRPKCDMGMVRGRLEEAVERLAPSCKQLVLMRSPGRSGPVFDRFRPRMEALFALIEELADRHGASVVDLYSAPSLGDPRMWDADRLHLTAEGHRRVAEAVWQTLGLPPELDWRAPAPASPPPRWADRRIRGHPLRPPPSGPLDRPPAHRPVLRGRPLGRPVRRGDLLGLLDHPRGRHGPGPGDGVAPGRRRGGQGPGVR